MSDTKSSVQIEIDGKNWKDKTEIKRDKWFHSLVSDLTMFGGPISMRQPEIDLRGGSGTVFYFDNFSVSKEFLCLEDKIAEI